MRPIHLISLLAMLGIRWFESNHSDKYSRTLVDLCLNLFTENYILRRIRIVPVIQ